MGMPLHSFCYRPDTKLCRLHTLSVSCHDRARQISDGQLSFGPNAVVAVIAHTGYDMEDAMIVNKGAMERDNDIIQNGDGDVDCWIRRKFWSMQCDTAEIRVTYCICGKASIRP